MLKLLNGSKPSNSDISREPVGVRKMLRNFSQFHVFDDILCAGCVV